MTLPVQHFQTTLTAGPAGHVFLPTPFEPAALWGQRAVYHLAGTIDGMAYRGVLEAQDGAWVMRLGAAWRRDCGLAAGDVVDVMLTPEGPQREGLAPDIASALDAEPEAGAFFDEIAQFYRRAYLTWIDATKRSPAKRAERIAATVELLKARQKERPK
ncbi:YdeI/OmpD-associated family protein [Caulobacter sp. SLTY]|uniref:YdeI/OmpD-associated family protein n=1 Tax=Caulobacter sp. SLTY TaxID=2683262 RepID=UPI00196A89E8